MMQRAQRQQQMAQDPQAVAQIAAQMLKQGVGGLPVNMQFKDGGIVGFDDGGTVRAGVRKTPSPQFDKEDQQLILEYLKQLGDMKLMAGLAMQEGNPTIAQLLASKGIGDGEISLGAMGTPSDLQSIMAGYSRPLAGGRVGVNATIPRYSPRDTQFGLSYSKQFADGGIIGFTKGGLSANDLDDAETGLQVRAAQEEKELIMGERMNLSRDVAQYLAARRRAAAAASYGAGTIGTQATESAIAEARGAPPTPAVAASSSIPAAQVPQAAPVPQAPPVPDSSAEPVVAPRRSTPPAPPKEDGIAALQAQLAGLQGQRPIAPTIQDVITQAKNAVESPKEGIERIKKIYDDREKAIEKMPNLEREGIAALEEAKAARKALLQKRREDDAYDTLRAFFRGLYTRGNDFDVARMGIKARDEQDALADLNHANSVLKLKQAEQARQLGKFDRQEAFEKEALSQMDKYSDNVAKSMQVTGTLLANVYNTDAQYVSQTLNRQAQQLIELAKLRQLYGQQEDTRQVQRITTLQAQLTNATKSVNDEMQKKFGPLLSILSVAKPEDLDKPDMKEQIARYKTEFANAQARFNIPELERVLQSEMSRYTRVESNVLRFDSSGNPVQ
jgi:hypothetical protein